MGSSIDALSNVLSNTDPSAKITRYAYDAAGNLTRVTDAAGGVTEYAYDPGRSSKLLAAVKDAKNQATTFGYDAQVRLVSVTNALGQTKTSAYDAKGNLTRTINARGQEITYAYDNRDRLTSKTMPEGVVSYAYDAAGNMTRVANHNGSVVELAYDGLNRVTQSKQTLPGGFQAIIGYGYDANGNRTSMTTPWGNFAYAYDALNRLTRITNPQGKIFDFEYNSAGRRTKLTYPNGIETAYEYDDAGQILSINHHRTSDQGVVAFSSYTYDAAGNRTSMKDLSGTHGYGYDDLHRLTSASHPAASFVPTKNEVFSYDAVGNRLADANITGYQYDAANRLLENSSFTYTYDADGSQTGKRDKVTLEQTAYIFDSENQLKEVDLPDGTIFTAKYDGLGKRIEKSTGPAAGRTTKYVYDNEDIVAMLDGNNDLTAVFTHGPWIDDPLMMRKTDEAEFSLHADVLGNIGAIADFAGGSAERIEFEAFGEPAFVDPIGPAVVAGHSKIGSPYGFNSRPFDSEIRLYFHEERYRDPLTGRFSVPDPIGFSGDDVNLYSYVFNQPTNLVDPAGTWALPGVGFPSPISPPPRGNPPPPGMTPPSDSSPLDVFVPTPQIGSICSPKDRGKGKGQDKGNNYILDNARKWLQANPNWRDPDDPDNRPICALLKRWYEVETDSKTKQAINAARKFARCK